MVTEQGEAPGFVIGGFTKQRIAEQNHGSEDSFHEDVTIMKSLIAVLIQDRLSVGQLSQEMISPHGCSSFFIPSVTQTRLQKGKNEVNSPLLKELDQDADAVKYHFQIAPLPPTQNVQLVKYFINLGKPNLPFQIIKIITTFCLLLRRESMEDFVSGSCLRTVTSCFHIQNLKRVLPFDWWEHSRLPYQIVQLVHIHLQLWP